MDIDNAVAESIYDKFGGKEVFVECCNIINIVLDAAEEDIVKRFKDYVDNIKTLQFMKNDIVRYVDSWMDTIATTLSGYYKNNPKLANADWRKMMNVFKNKVINDVSLSLVDRR